MSQVVQAKCPGCQNVLRIPADWTGQSVRCKHCGRVIQIKSRSAGGAPARAPTGAARTPPAPPAPAATRGDGKTARAAATGRAAAPPAEVPMAEPVAAAPPPTAVPQAAPAPADDQPFGHFDDGSPSVVPRDRRKRTPWGTCIAGGVLVLLLAAFSGSIALNVGGTRSRLVALFNSSPSNGEGTRAAGLGPRGKESDLPKPPKDFPRRMLAISVNNYLYFNPVSYGDGDQSVGGVMKKLADALHIPEDQTAELSDGAPNGPAPLKPVIQTTISDFLDGSRAQDRLILLFVGHAVAIDKEAYLVPLEGEQGAKETLIPLSWVYDQLVKCKARQKVLILDVCRLDPTRGLERPGSGPMDDAVDAALQKPPPGVQVWSACTAGQSSFEGYLFISNGSTSHGGIFLGELWESVGPFKKRVKIGIQKPEDSLPFQALAMGNDEVRGVNRGTEYEVKEDYQDKQTPRLVGEEAADGAPFNPEEPMPPRLVIKPPPSPPGGVAAPDLITTVLQESGADVARQGSDPLKLANMPPFDAKVMAPYAKDLPPTDPVRQAITNAIKVLGDTSKDLKEEFRGAANDTIKKDILKQQEEPARAIFNLQDAEDQLDKLADDADNAPKRWQVIYKLVKAKLEARLAYVDEYDYMLGQIRKDALPPRDPTKYAGWRLASQVKLQSGSRARDHAKGSQKILEKMATKYKGTPWEILAKREMLTALGLKWTLVPMQ